MQYENFDCNNCLCIASPTQEQVLRKERLEEQWLMLESMVAFVQAKKAARGRDEEPSQVVIDQYRKASRRTRSQYDDYHYMTSTYTPYYVGGAAACGAGDGGCGAGCG